MARIVALTRKPVALSGAEWLRPLIVAGCSLALILARGHLLV